MPNITSLTIRGNGIRSGGQPVKIYTNGGSYTPTFENASNFIFYTDRNFYVGNSSDDNSSDFTIHHQYTAGTRTGTFNGTNSNFTLYTTETSTFNGTNSNFTLYTTGATNLNNTVGTTANPFRIVSTNTITAGADAVLTNGIVITGPVAVADTNR